VKFVPGPGFANHVATPFNYNLADEPIFIGVMGYTESGGDLYFGQSWLRWGTGSPLLYCYTGTDDFGAHLTGFGTAGSISGEYRLDNPEIRSIRNRPHFCGAQFGGSAHTLNACLNGEFAALTAGSVTSGRPGFGPVWFLQPAAETVPQVVQTCVLIYGSVSNAPMKQLWPLLATTLAADNRPTYTFLQQAGQSNSGNAFRYQLAENQWGGSSPGLFSTNNTSYGGQSISYWVGPNPDQPIRTTAYENARKDMIARMPPTPLSRWRGVYFWMQGESDTEPDAPSLVYRENLTSYLGFVREDTRPDLVIGVGLIDVITAIRTSGLWGNFSLTECAGTATAANGSWSIVAHSGLAEAYLDYQFTNGNWTLHRNAGHWELAKSGTVHFTSVEDSAHPGLVTHWTPSAGASGIPTLSQNHTLSLERVRQAQRDYVAGDHLSFLVDSRGCERYGDTAVVNDVVHLNNAGFAQLAARFTAAYAIAAP
jgi:hypothetical protein